MSSVSPVTASELGTLPDVFAFETASWTARETGEEPRNLIEAVATLPKMIDDGSLERGFWLPAQVVGATINQPLTRPNRLLLIREATKFALTMYAGTASLEAFEDLAANLEREGLMTTKMLPVYDGPTTDHSTAELSRQTAEKLAHKVNKETLLAIATCQGGFVAAAQIFLSLQRFRQDVTGNDALHPMRNSAEKMRDTVPYASDSEIEMLKEASSERRVVVIDEDANTGRSMTGTLRLIGERVTSFSSSTLGVVNYDNRSKRNRERQGEWWENHVPSRLRAKS